MYGFCPPAKTAFSGGFFAGGDEARSQPGKTKVLAVRTREASFAPCGGKAQRARIARAFGTTYSSLLLTHYKSGTDGRCAPLRSFAPCGGKAQRARIARAFGTTYSSLLLTHNKKAADKSLWLFCGAPTHFISELFALSNSESVIVSVPSL